MKILYVNNFFSAKGGAESIMVEEAKLMEALGHDVHFFATDRDPYFRAEEPYTQYFPRHIDFRDTHILQKLRSLPQTIVNQEAQTQLVKVLRLMQPDLVHVHNLHYQLTPAILAACDRLRSQGGPSIPMVMTLHDVRLVCPGGTFYNNGQSESLCQTGNPWACLKTRCKNGSLSETLLCFAEYFYSQIFDHYHRIHTFITPSQALKDLMIRKGLPADKLVHINNFLTADAFKIQPQPENQGYFLYVGRLSQEKGIQYLLNAMAQLPHLNLRIIGTGPYEPDLKQQATELALENVNFLGFLTTEALIEQYQHCIATVLPIVWFEIFGLTIIESFLHGKPVIASELGAIPELIQDGETGLLTEPGNVSDLALKLEFLAQNPDLGKRMGQAGRAKVNQEFTPERHQVALMALYQSILAS
jgi:glycosyltransferase involved in cell wall biosynthesis